MHYSKLIKIGNMTNDCYNSSHVVSTQVPTAPVSVENTELNDDEINEVLCFLLHLQEKYFSEIPLCKDLCKQFMWNIPRNVYNAFKKCQNYMLPDAMNPIYWFYMFCVDEPSESLSKFIITAINSVSDEDYTELEKASDMYDYNNMVDDENNNIGE